MTRQKQVFLAILLFLFLAVIFMLTNPFVSKEVKILKQDEYLDMYIENSFSFLKIFSLLVTSSLIFNHDEKEHIQLIVAKKRVPFFLNKVKFYFFYIILLQLLFLLIYLLSSFIFIYGFKIDVKIQNFLIKLLLDNILFMMLVVFFIKRKLQLLTFMLLIYLIFIHIILEVDEKVFLIMFYINPFFWIKENYVYSYIYWVIYALMLFLIAIVHNKNKKLT